MISQMITFFLLLPLLLPSYFLNLIGHKCFGKLGALLGFILYTIGFRRKIVEANLHLALSKEKIPEELQKLTKDIYTNIGTVFLEILRNIYFSRKQMIEELLIDPDGLTRMESLLNRGTGAIFLSAHIANWELSGIGMAARGYPVSVVAKRMNNRLSQALLERIRIRSNLNIIYAGNTIEKMKIALKNKQFIGFMMDQNITGKKGIRANFFNVPASSIRALSRLVKETGAPVVPFCIHRRPDGRHEARIFDELPYLRVEGPDEDGLREEWINTQAYQNAVEMLVRLKPEQWLWIHRRWKADRTPFDPETVHLENKA
jgi:KDO2-lipid IV(A) lauroyltransferase